MRIKIRPDGTMQFIHSDRLTTAVKERFGSVAISRASHVEPTEDGRWTADMGPSGGPVLGPFDTRQDALDAEVDWLRENLNL